jgi:hypothetical protein
MKSTGCKEWCCKKTFLNEQVGLDLNLERRKKKNISLGTVKPKKPTRDEVLMPNIQDKKW